MLDMLCLTGEVGWARLSAPTATTVVSATPIALFLRANAEAWQAPRGEVELSPRAAQVLEILRTRGASFARDLGHDRARVDHEDQQPQPDRAPSEEAGVAEHLAVVQAGQGVGP